MLIISTMVLTIENIGKVNIYFIKLITIETISIRLATTIIYCTYIITLIALLLCNI
jgi:hypothetical protein